MSAERASPLRASPARPRMRSPAAKAKRASSSPTRAPSAAVSDQLLLSNPKENEKPAAARKSVAARKRVTKRATRRGRNPETYNRYIYRVLKVALPAFRISQTSMDVLDSFVKDMFGLIASEAGHLCQINNRATMTGREIQTAVRLILPGDLATHAVSEGIKAVNRFFAQK